MARLIDLAPYLDESLERLMFWEIQDCLWGYRWKRWGSVAVRSAEIIAGGHTLAIKQTRGYGGPGTMKTELELKHLDGTPVDGEAVGWQEGKNHGGLTADPEVASKAFELIGRAKS